jgi:hypothetical protein
MQVERFANAEERAATLDEEKTALMQKLAKSEAKIAELSHAKSKTTPKD